MSKKVGTKRYDQKVVNAIILAIVLALLVYLGIQISRGFSSKVSTQRTQVATESGYAYLDGCIFRNDVLVTESGDVVYYTVQNGEKVGEKDLFFFWFHKKLPFGGRFSLV